MTKLFYAFVTNDVCNDFVMTLPTKYVGCITASLQHMTTVDMAPRVKVKFNHVPVISMRETYAALCGTFNRDNSRRGERIYVFRDISASDLTFIGLKMTYNNAFAFTARLARRGTYWLGAARAHLASAFKLAELHEGIDEFKKLVAASPETARQKKVIANLSIPQSVLTTFGEVGRHYIRYFDQHFRTPLTKLK